MSLLRGKLLLNESLAHYTSWRAGGVARQLYQPADVADLQYFLQYLSPNEPILWLGLGSNTLIRDGGFPGTVIVTQGLLKSLEHIDPTRIRAEVGVSCAAVARYAARLGLTGLEFLAGIPGTMGGALRMNAGCFGGETWRYVTAVTTIDRSGNLHERKREEFAVAYREVEGLKDEWFISGDFILPAGDKETSLAMIRDLLAKRAATQPTGEYSCGSVFRNPPGDYAGRLIEAAGLKGYQIGGAKVSTKHANFILNEGEASAAEIEALLHYVRTTIATKFGIALIPEVHIIGETNHE